ncbi:LamG-like jellyroll fold domain-containing protein [Solihabitans fulvus]|nr:LamG-like jellyroll fold domain-containing protein [Solihabitans fulvus]
MAEVVREQLATQQAQVGTPGPGPDQRWGSAEGQGHQDAPNRGNTADARAEQAKYPPIKGQDDPHSAANSAHVAIAASKKARGFEATSSKELPDKRSRNERTYANADGTQTTQFSKTPLNYQRADGSWAPIDTNLVADHGWRNTADAVQVHFAERSGAAAVAELTLDPQHSLKFGLDGAADIAGNTQGSTITYPGVRANSDLELQVKPGGLKETLVLRSPQAPRTWLFPLHLNGLTATVVDKRVVLRDEKGVERAQFPRGFMTDAKVDNHTGNPATSYGVTYSLVQRDGQQLLQVDLDSAWLNDPARTYPVRVDPPVETDSAGSSMYVQRNGDGTNFSQVDGELKAGHSYDSSGNYTAATYVAFPGVENSLRNHKIFGVQLGLTNYQSWSCNPRPVTVYPVTEVWQAGTGYKYPGPAYGDALGSAEFAHGFIASGTTASACPTATEAIGLGDAGRDLVQRWVTGQQANYGLTVRGSETDEFGWKKFTGAGTANPPLLSITHTAYDATYRFDNPVPDPPVTRTQGGKVKLTVTNQGADTWTTGEYALAYRYFTSDGTYQGWAEASTLPQNVPRGASVSLDAYIQPTPPGTYRFEFTMIRRGVVFFTDEQIPSAALDLQVINIPPAIKEQYPPNGYSAPTLTPSLWARAIKIDAPPDAGLQYRFHVCEKGTTNCVDSGRQANQTWTVPVGALGWSKTYQWQAFAWDGTSESPALPLSDLLTTVPQPEVTSHLGNAPYGGGDKDFDPQVGNYTSSAVDASATTVGPELTVARTYNSLDPRRDAAFGAGWSSSYDMRITPDSDGSGNVVVTYPDGQQVRFGANKDSSGQPTGGRLVPPAGRYATLVPYSAAQGGGWTMTDKADNFYVFGAAGRLIEQHDTAGRWVQLSYDASGALATATNKTSGRALHFAWSGAHVRTVSTDPVNGTASTWTYEYNGDKLTKVCDPAGGCTRYDYAAGSHYRSAVLDSKPDSYWRLGESGGTTASSQVSINLGKDNGTYNSDVKLLSPGALAGSGDAAASFTGNNAAVTLPDGLVKKSRELTVELWFNTTKDGPLFGAQNAAYGANPNGAVPLLYVGTDGKLRGQFWINQAPAPITTAAPVNDGSWHHVVLTSSLATQTLFLDGKPVGSKDGAIDNSTLAHSQIGASYAFAPSDWDHFGTDTRRSFTGVIDEVAVYQHALGQPAVQAHYAARSGADELAKITLPSGKSAAQLSYDTTNDRLTSYTDRNGGTWQLSTPVTTGTDTNIVRTVRVIDPGKRAHFYDFDPMRGRIIRYLAPLGMDARSEDKPPPTTTTTPPPTPTCTTPGPGGQFCDVPVSGGPGTFIPVDLQGARSYDYDETGFQSTITDENANQVTLKHDQRGNIVSRTTCRTGPTDCQTTSFEYFTGDNLTDPRLDKVTATRDARSASATDNTYKTSYTYDTFGNLATQTTPDGAVVRHTYTAAGDAAIGGGNTPAGLVAKSVDPRGATTLYRYYATGDLAEVESATHLITRFTYDALGRRATVTQITTDKPAGITTTIGYDALSRPTTATQPGVTNPVTGVTHTLRTTTHYDPDGNPDRVDASDLTGGDATRTSTMAYDDRGRRSAVTDAEGRETHYGYDSFGNRTWMVGPDGVKYEYAYTARNKIAEVRLRGWREQGRGEPGPGDYLVTDSYAYDLAGQLVAHTDAMGRKTGYTYYSDGLLRQTIARGFHNPDNTTRDIVLADNTYDAASKLVSQTTAGGRVTASAYDAVGRVASTTVDPKGLARRTLFAYDLAGNVTRVTRTGNESNTGVMNSSDAEIVDYGYDDAGRQTTETVETDTDNLTTTRGYDQRGLLTSVTDPRGAVAGADPAAYTTTLGYDDLGRSVTSTAPTVSVESAGKKPSPAQPTTRTGYNSFGQTTDSVDANGNTRHTSVDRIGRTVSATSPNYTQPGAQQAITPTSRIDYDGAGNIKAVTDPLGAVTRFAYDQLHRLTDRTDPDPKNPGQPGGVWHYTYTRVGEQLSVTNPTGAISEATYDDLGRSVTATQRERYPTAGTFTSSVGYDDANNLTVATTPSGATTRNTYDAVGALTKTVDPAGVPTQFGYDLAGRNVKTVDGLGRAQRTTVDLAGHPVASADLAPNGTLLRRSTAAYDVAGNLTSTTDVLGRISTFTYDALGRLTNQAEPESVTTSFGYDAAGNRTRYTDGRGNATNYTVNVLGLPESVIEPSTQAHPNAGDRTWTVSYDAAGHPTQMTAPGGITRQRTFDGLGRMTKETGGGAESATADRVSSYDALGRLVGISAPGADDTFTYNDRGALLSTDGPSGKSGFAYNADSQPTSRVDAAGTAAFGYTAGRLSSVVDAITGTTQTPGYNPAGQVSTVDYGAGRTRTFGYDDLGRLTDDKLGVTADPTQQRAAAQVSSVHYGYDLGDQLTGKTTTGVAGAGDNTYGYDQLGRLTSWTGGGKTTAYGWDAASNRTKAGDKTAIFDERNRLLSDGTSTYNYSPRGTTAGKKTGPAQENFSFDAFDRLVAEATTNYGYDGLDRVVKRNDRAFAYSGMGNTLASDGTGTFSRGPGGDLLALAQGADKRLAVSDRHGDLVGTINPTGALTQLADSITYDPFGQVTATGGTKRPIGFQGGWTDPDTNQVNMSARWYNPASGSFTSRDDVSLPDNPSSASNRYTYAGGSPLNYIDPTGHDWSFCDDSFSWADPICWFRPNKIPGHANPAPVDPPEDPCSGAPGVSWVPAVSWDCSPPPPNTCGGTVPPPVPHDPSRDAGGGLSCGYRGTDPGADPGPDPVQPGPDPGRPWHPGSNTPPRSHPSTPPPPDPAVGARQAQREAVRSNPLPVPQAMLAPIYGGSTEAPVSSSPTSSSKTVGVQANPVDDVQRSYREIVNAITDASRAVIGSVKDSTNAPSELANTGWSIDNFFKNAKKVFKDITGIADAQNCFTRGDLKACGMTLLAVLPGLKAVRAAGNEIREAGALRRAEGEVRSSESCLGNSFSGDTPVLMADGVSKPIRDVKVGDRVENSAPDSETSQRHVVTAIHITDADRDFVDLTIATPEGFKSITSTVHHLFYDSTTRAWTVAEDLKVGDELNTPGNGRVNIVASRHYSAQLRTFNLTIEALHTFYVEAGATPILVHNINAPIGCGLNGEPIFEIPPGSEGGPGAGRRIPAEKLRDYDIGVGATPGSTAPLCSYCRANPGTSLDHVLPRSKNGDLTDPNLTPSCTFCNSSKRDRVAPLNPPANYTGPWPPSWWPARMRPLADG